MKPQSFRKKPVVIQAIQLLWENWNDICDFVPFEYGTKGCYIDQEGMPTEDYPGENSKLGMVIHTLEGNHLAVEGDWIICGVAGEFYPCKPDIFEQTYERV